MKLSCNTVGGGQKLAKKCHVLFEWSLQQFSTHFLETLAATALEHENSFLPDKMILSLRWKYVQIVKSIPRTCLCVCVTHGRPQTFFQGRAKFTGTYYLLKNLPKNIQFFSKKFKTSYIGRPREASAPACRPLWTPMCMCDSQR